jgi:Methyltransferase domain
MSSAVGQDTYEWLTAVVLGTQRGMSRKWCYWFREHVVLCRRVAHFGLHGKRVWLFQPGWSLAPIMLSYVVTGRGPLVTEDRRRLSRRYLPNSITEVTKHASRICKTAGAEGEFAPAFISRLESCSRSPRRALEICQATYSVGDLSRLASLPSDSVDISLSMGRLEHLSEAELSFLMSEMYRLTTHGGIGSHIVDHRDHFSYYDKSIHCFHHLSFSDQSWAAIAKRGKVFRNRLLEPDYIRLFQRAGFEVLAAIHELHKHDADHVDPKTLWGPYADLTPQDLEAAVSHFIVRRQ